VVVVVARVEAEKCEESVHHTDLVEERLVPRGGTRTTERHTLAREDDLRVHRDDTLSEGRALRYVVSFAAAD